MQMEDKLYYHSSRMRFHLLAVTALMVFWVGGCEQTTMPIPTVNYAGRQRATYQDFGGRNRSRVTAVSHPWVPGGGIEDLRRWEGIIVHHSASDTGDAASMDSYHRNIRNWDSLGYHFVIDNGNNSHNKHDGMVEVGIRWRQQKHGAHCRVDVRDDNYWNEHTIGICLVGNFEEYNPSPAQYSSLVELVKFLQDRYRISANKIYGHGDIEGARTKCPGRNFSWSTFRQMLSGK